MFNINIKKYLIMQNIITPISPPIDSYNDICVICYNKSVSPVTLNSCGLDNNNNIKPIKCAYSLKNPTCLTCTRKYIKSKYYKYKCLAGCCKIKNKSFLAYGELNRSPDNVAEPKRWKEMGSNGITKCYRCDEECNTVLELGVHIKKKCKLTKIKCFVCSEYYNRYEEKEHQKNCYFYCRWCGPTKNITIYFDKNNKKKIRHNCLENNIKKSILNKHSNA